MRITNTAEISLSNISLQDTIPAGLQFINGTVFINGERSPLANPNIGFQVTTNLEPNETIIVLFTVQVISPPVTNEFKNTANISLQLQASPTDPPITVTVTSNENIVTFVPENPDKHFQISIASLTVNASYGLLLEMYEITFGLGFGGIK